MKLSHSTDSIGPSIPRSRVLIFRLSSLGDVILASSSLSVAHFEPGMVDWVVAKEFSLLLKAHSKIGRVWEFDRKSGLKGWVRLCRELHAQGYTEIYDLHQSLRTRMARLIFWWLDRRSVSSQARVGALSRTWSVFSKQRIRLYGYFCFKRLWPTSWRPEKMVVRYARQVGGTGNERPDLRHLLNVPEPYRPELEELERARPFICVMPGARWPGKRWPSERYVETLKELSPRWTPVILGTAQDRESVELEDALIRQGVPHLSGVGKWSLPQVARVLARSAGYLGSDTGLAHLAEAVGVSSWMIFGPTVPDMGFGPWRQGSFGIGKELWCRPCGKDGRYCFRPVRRFHCMQDLKADRVIAELSAPKSPQGGMS